MTVKEIIELGVKRFAHAKLCYHHGTDNSWDEAVAIVSYVMNVSPLHNDTLLYQEINQEQQSRILQYFKLRIEKNIPVPYLTNRAYFAGYEFYVDERVIIPRSPIAELILSKFEPWISPNSLLDLCTGSGCIAIAAALQMPSIKVAAVDISVDALEVAEKNIKKHCVEKQIDLIQSDLFDKVGENKYDLIVSNPPYVNDEEYHSLPREFLHEPKIALNADQMGLFVVDNILKKSANYLTEKGALIVEVGSLSQKLEQHYPHIPFTWIELAHGGEGIFLLYKDQLKVV